MNALGTDVLCQQGAKRLFANLCSSIGRGSVCQEPGCRSIAAHDSGAAALYAS